jgi:SAM-dependent methyltransferase
MTNQGIILDYFHNNHPSPIHPDEFLSDQAKIQKAKQLNIKALLETATTIYLEIGCGFRPHIASREYVNGAAYLGIDGGSHDNQDSGLWIMTEAMAARAILRNRHLKTRPPESIHYLLADGRALPLPDASVGEVYMANVVGNGMSYADVEAICRESYRVLASAGHLVVRESITPLDPSVLLEISRRAGLTAENGMEAINAPYESTFSK